MKLVGVIVEVIEGDECTADFAFVEADSAGQPGPILVRLPGELAYVDDLPVGVELDGEFNASGRVFMATSGRSLDGVAAAGSV